MISTRPNQFSMLFIEVKI